MNADDWEAHYDAIFEGLAVEATIDIGTAGEIAVLAIDRTAGMEINDGVVGVHSIRPAAVIRTIELSETGLTLAELNDATLTMNGRDWRIVSKRPRPSPAGEDVGEVILILKEA